MSKADRDINKLDPVMLEKVKLFLKEVGHRIFVTEAFRTYQRQLDLYAQGRTTPGKIVTWTMNSPHMEGKAIDIAFKGSELYPASKAIWKDIAKVANKYEIDWGYDLWGKDLPHFQDNGKPLERISGHLYSKYLPKNTEDLDDIIKEYEQDPKLCHIFAPIGALSDLWNLKLSSDHIKNLLEGLRLLGVDITKGGNYMQSANYVKIVWNKMFPEMQSDSCLLKLNSKEFNEKFMQKYSIVISRKTSKLFLLDWLDGVLNGGGRSTYNGRHATRVKYHKQKMVEINNKKDTFSTNIAEYKNWASHIKNGWIREYGIIFFKI